MRSKIHRPSAALVVASIALFVALSGTAVAAGVVPLAKRALLADNAKKLQGKSPAQIAALVQVAPPVTSLASFVNVKSQAYSLAASQQNDYTTACDAGQKAIGGGIDEVSGTAFVFDSRPSPDGGGWRMYVANFSDAGASAGTIYAICLK